MATLDGDELVYVARVPAARSMTITLRVGARLPAYPTSMGRVLLAALPDTALDEYLSRTRFEQLTPHTIGDPARLRKVIKQVNVDGFALVDQEREEGVRSAAVPIHDAAGRVIAALNISANAGRVPLPRMHEEFVPALTETGRAISADLGFRPPQDTT